MRSCLVSSHLGSVFLQDPQEDLKRCGWESALKSTKSCGVMALLQKTKGQESKETSTGFLNTLLWFSCLREKDLGWGQGEIYHIY